jgi:hypothetical protein
MTRDLKSQSLINRKLPELVALERLIKALPASATVNLEATVSYRELDFPIYSVVLGTQDKTAPCLGVFGGVHGLERIGAEVVLAWLQTLVELTQWDETFNRKLENSRIVFMPIVNPIGTFLTRRSNGNGVDLMRNSPVVAEEPPAFLLGGQTFSRALPWFRGDTSAFDRLEPETRALAQLVQREIFPSKLSLTVDVHSGFGSVDRLWFPYAKTRKPPPHILEITAIKRLFDRTYPNHFYHIEPQSKSYTTHGDLWDWLYDMRNENTTGFSLPLTLELGSWMWLKKNPRQLFSSLGAFNPIQPHRLQRILRRHITLFDFLHRAVLNPTAWTQFDDETRRQLQRRSIDLWYGEDER